MYLRKQKQDSMKRLSGQSRTKECLFLAEFRAAIVPVEFSLREVDVYGSVLPIELLGMESATVDEQALRQLLVDCLKLLFIFDPLLQTLSQQHPHTHFPLKAVIRVLLHGEFYRFIDNSDNQLKILINNQTTDANVKIALAALVVTALKKLTPQDINAALLFFSLESALYDPQQLTIPMDNQKIIKVLRKLERVIKPVEYKIWAEGTKTARDFRGHIEAHHFLYLCSLTEKKFSKGLGSIIFRPKIQSFFKDLNSNLKTVQPQPKQLIKEIKEDRRMIRGLSFVDVRPKQLSFSKQILREFRLRNPSKFKRPDTALLRRHVSTFLPRDSDLNSDWSGLQLKMAVNCQIQQVDLSKFSRKSTTPRVGKRNMKENKSVFKLKLDRKQ